MKFTLILLFITVLNIACPEQKPVENVKFLTVESDSVSFAVIGDFGYAGDPAQKVAGMVKGWNPEFIISLGDNSYTDQTGITISQNVGQYYCDYIYNYDAPESYRCDGKAFREKINRFFPVTGNHDFNRRNATDYLNYFSLRGNELNYDFVWGPVHFIALNSGHDGRTFDINSNVAEELKNKLETSTHPWKIIYFHHPPYSVGHHGSYLNMQWPFKEWGASLVLAGHDHIYARINKKDENNFYYIVNGLGGHPAKYNCNSNPLDSNLFNVFCYNENWGAMKVNATDEKMQIGFFTIENEILIDTLTLIR